MSFLALVVSGVSLGCSTPTSHTSAVNLPEEKPSTQAAQEPEPRVFLVGLTTRQIQSAIPYRKGLTFTGAIGLVGGYTTYAKPRLYIIRRGNVMKIDLKAAIANQVKDAALEPWDVIYEPKRQW